MQPTTKANLIRNLSIVLLFLASAALMHYCNSAYYAWSLNMNWINITAIGFGCLPLFAEAIKKKDERRIKLFSAVYFVALIALIWGFPRTTWQQAAGKVDLLFGTPYTYSIRTVTPQKANRFDSAESLYLFVLNPESDARYVTVHPRTGAITEDNSDYTKNAVDSFLESYGTETLKPAIN